MGGRGSSYKTKKNTPSEINAIKRYVEFGASLLNEDEYDIIEKLTENTYLTKNELQRISYINKSDLIDIIDNTNFNSDDIDLDYPIAKFQNIDLKLKYEYHTDLWNDDYNDVPARSFSKGKTGAPHFSIADKELGQVNVLYVLPKGRKVKGIDISDISRIKQENEVLLNKKNDYKITKLRYEDDVFKIFLDV